MRPVSLGILLLVGALLSAGCGAAAPHAAPVSSRSLVTAAFVKQAKGTQAAGGPVAAAGASGVSLRPVPGATFGVILVLRNRSHRRLVVEDVHAVVPHGSFLRPLGTHLAPFFQCKPKCSRHLVMRGPYGPEQTAAVRVLPAHAAQAQMDFAIAGCGALQTASATPVTQAIVVYRDARGARYREAVSLRSSRLDLQRSGPITCRE